MCIGNSSKHAAFMWWSLLSIYMRVCGIYLLPARGCSDRFGRVFDP